MSPGKHAADWQPGCPADVCAELHSRWGMDRGAARHLMPYCSKPLEPHPPVTHLSVPWPCILPPRHSPSYWLPLCQTYLQDGDQSVHKER